MTFLLVFGILLCLAAIALLGLFILRARKLKTLDESTRQEYANKLITLNLGALLLATFGLMMVLFALSFMS